MFLYNAQGKIEHFANIPCALTNARKPVELAQRCGGCCSSSNLIYDKAVQSSNFCSCFDFSFQIKSLTKIIFPMLMHVNWNVKRVMYVLLQCTIPKRCATLSIQT
jgi:hypothetical protein